MLLRSFCAFAGVPAFSPCASARSPTLSYLPAMYAKAKSKARSPTLQQKKQEAAALKRQQKKEAEARRQQEQSSETARKQHDRRDHRDDKVERLKETHFFDYPPSAFTLLVQSKTVDDHLRKVLEDRNDRCKYEEAQRIRLLFRIHGTPEEVLWRELKLDEKDWSGTGPRDS